MHFGENQLSPNSISFSLLSTPHPRLFQQASVRSSTPLHRSFNLDMDRSSGFGSIMQNYAPYSDSVSLRLRSSCSLTSLCTITRRLILQKAYRHIPQRPKTPAMLRSLVGTRVQVSFTPRQGCFSPFPLGTLLYRSSDIFSLGPWAAQIQPEFLVLRPTQVSSTDRRNAFAYGALTLCGWLSQYHSTDIALDNCPSSLQPAPE